ncbi:hypothetical protein FRB94_000024 [Tulasnella sp. JGI-2019a]|nr:hypothetical protein FRB94_000024 [Tulasnella sp. JGI-2019a]
MVIPQIPFILEAEFLLSNQYNLHLYLALVADEYQEAATVLEVRDVEEGHVIQSDDEEEWNSGDYVPSLGNGLQKNRSE